MSAAYIYLTMEVKFTELKRKDVININDGKNLGRVCDLSFTFPESEVLGFTVTGCKGFKFTKQEVFLPMKSIVKIGEDAVLVKLEGGGKPPEKHPPKKDKCPQPCPPPCPPPHCPPQNYCPPPRNVQNNGYYSDRISYDEYE